MLHKYEEWQVLLQSARSGDAQQEVLNCIDLLTKVALPTSNEAVQKAAATLFLVSKSGARRSDEALTGLCKSIEKWWGSKLTEFDAGGGCPIASLLLTDECLALIVRCSPGLQVVRLYGCMHITDWGLKQLAAEKPPLHIFSLEWCGGGVYLGGLQAVIRSCTLLKTFSISSGQESYSLGSITDELVLELVTRCPRIAVLELSDTRHCKALQFFSAASSAVTDDSLPLLGSGCPELAFVSVDRCRHVSLDGIMRLVNRSPAVQYVEMAGLYQQSTAEQRVVFGAWVQRRGMHYDARSDLLAGPLNAAAVS